MALDHRFYVGPLGSLRALPDVLAPVSVPVTRIGGIHRSLAGGLTVDTFARKRAWTWTYDILHPNDLAYLEALQYGTIRGPLRLIDPHRRNRLNEDHSTGGSVTRSNVGFFTDAGSFSYWHPLTEATTADITTLGPRALLSGYQEWYVQVPTADNFVYLGDPRARDRRWKVPVLPGETIEVSSRVLGPVNAQVWQGVMWLDANDSPMGLEAVQDPVTVGMASWTKLIGEVTAPPGAAACTPDLHTSSSSMPPGGSILHTAWQVASPEKLEPFGMVTHHCEVEDVSDGWHLGGGAPFVVADAGEIGYLTEPVGFHSAGLTLYET